ncbi:hypothetical protein K432DRAFT_196876 [Lepidopterella palustris CBS 459.81]|uniref:Uncharacterized protein n=1 Tax=Lepidopterella palustris CBS 459.81 TaxID=1314670 RepID=A0A8E2EFI4_9PEZI|nr:hypothetical protein K432DRAFT_196876 [Lepidopterella palustris CBS 459.81]
MSTGQKSFFDQNTKPKSRPYWHRTHSSNDVSRHNHLPKDVMKGSPIAASTQTKTKLKAFQFIEGRPAANNYENDADQENQPVEVEGQKPQAVPKSQGDVPQEAQVMSKSQGDIPQKATQTPKLLQSKTCPPSTPATRLPLADLVGNSNDASRRGVIHNTSPDEQLYWRNVQSPTSSNTITTPAPRRGKKRARSSSPLGPSQTEPSNFAKEPFDLQGMQQILKTPHADPAADLWNRYTVNATTKTTPAASKGIALAQLINESSPHSSATAGSVSGLRRWASCGLEWPTSVTKRRKTRGAFRGEKGNLEDGYGVSSTDDPMQGKSKLSKVGILLEKIQETMVKPPVQNASSFPSSSSPYPEVGEFCVAPALSPLQRLSRGQRNDIKHGADSRSSPEPPTPAVDDNEEEQNANLKPTSSSEYGDVDIDIDMVEAIEANCTAQQNPPVAAGATIFLEAIQESNPADCSIAIEPPKQDTLGSDDEFGLEDEDIFDADLENLASLYDARPDLTPAVARDTQGTAAAENILKAPDPPPIINLCEEESSDEFGDDDIDVEQFAVAEAIATQAFNASPSTQHSVRLYQSYSSSKYNTK